MKKNNDLELLKTIENQIISDQIYNSIIQSNFESLKEWFDFGNKCNINDSLFTDIDLFNCENNVLDNVNQCITPFGLEFTKRLLCNPTNNIDILQKRQNMIKKVLTNDTVYSEIKNKLNVVKSVYKDVLWFFNKHDEETTQFFKKTYFENKQIDFANNNIYALASLSLMNLFVFPFINIIYPLSAIFLPYQYLKLKGYSVSVKNIIDILITIIKQMFSSIKQIGLMIFSVVCYFYSAYNSIQSTRRYYKISSLIKTKLNAVITFINTSYDLVHSENNPFYDKKIIKTFDNLKHFIINKDITKSLLNPSSFESNGQILKFFNDLLCNTNNIHKDLSNVMQYIGKLDYLYSMSSLLKTEKFSFPIYSNSNKPFMICRDLWHPCLDSDKIVYNSIDTSKNIILTGPNAGGKSTFIKNILLNITLSQSIGICNSKYFEFTPFYLIYTHINIPDTKGKESLFEAEVNRILSYIQNTSKLSEYEFGIGVFDEILTSTNVEEGLSVAKSMCEEFNKMNNSLSIITTHFDSLTSLNLNRFENYKVVIDIKDNDITFLYKVVKGVSDQKIAIELLRKKGFNSNIIENAINYKNDMKLKLGENI